VDAASAEHPADAPVRLGRVAIVGGGCYGTFYARQLLAAQERGKAEIVQLLVVDRDPRCRFAAEVGPGRGRELVVAEWEAFFERFLAEPRSAAGAPDAIVPSPLMPHLMFEWLVGRARTRWPGRPVEVRPLEASVGTPYDALGPDGTRYVSHADWICPVHCIEPLTCPVIRGPRTWEMGDTLQQLVHRLDLASPTAGPFLFECRHRVHGVGMFDVAAVQAADARMAAVGASGGTVDLIVGTVSACHGAVGVLRLGPAAGGGRG
jgi:hypothetical protein